MSATFAKDREDRPPLARIAPPLFDLLFSGCKAEHYEAGQHIFLQEDPSDRMYGMIAGAVEISLFAPDGRKLVANIEFSPSLIGEIGALDGRPRTATAICLEASRLVSVSRAQLHERIERHPPLARAMIELVCARIRWVSSELGDQAFLGVQARLAKRLIFLSRIMADPSGWIAMSQSELAEFLGATRESVNKTLNDWRMRKYIDLHRGGLHVVDAGALRHIASQHEA